MCRGDRAHFRRRCSQPRYADAAERKHVADGNYGVTLGARRERVTRSRLRNVASVISALLAVGAVGCVQEMANQPRYEPLQASAVFEDGMSSRPPVPGTVARGQLQHDIPFFTGMEGGEPVATLPQQVLADQTMDQLLVRGRQRYAIFCANCHGHVGGGTGGAKEYESLIGMVVARGFPPPPTYHQPRLRQVPIGYLFDVITRGYGRMPAHDYLVPPQDRWAIAAYIRALQLSQYAMVDELSPADRQQLEAQTASPF